MCRCCFGARQGRSGWVVTHQSVSRVLGAPEATSAQHVAFPRFVVAHHSTTGVPVSPEPTSVQHVEAISQRVTRQLLCRCLVTECALRLRTWLTPAQTQCCQTHRGSTHHLTESGVFNDVHGRAFCRRLHSHTIGRQKARGRARGAHRGSETGDVGRRDALSPPPSPLGWLHCQHGIRCFSGRY